MGIIVFDVAKFKAFYPEFEACSDTQLSAYFDMAGVYCLNATQNPAFSDGILPALLNMVTAHIAWLRAPRDANGKPSTSGLPPSNLVGRIASANQGSVSASAEIKSDGGPSQDYFMQTTYGMDYWQASAAYRTAVYIARPTNVPTAIFPYRGRRRAW